MNIERDDGALWLFGFIIAVVCGLCATAAILFLAAHELYEAARWVLA